MKIRTMIVGRSSRLLSALALFAALAACARPPVLPPPRPEVGAKLLLERLSQSAQAFRSLEGVAKSRVQTPGRSIGATQVLSVEKPDRLRAETLNPFGFGSPVMLLATDGSELSVMVPSSGSFYRGEASSANILRFTRLPLQVSDLVQFLLYQVPIIRHEERSLLELEEGYLLLLSAGGRRQELRFDLGLQLVEAGYYYEEKLQLKVSYGKFTAEGHPFPTESRLEMPQQGTEATLAFSEVRTNVSIPGDRFVLRPPKGIEVLPIP